MVRMFNFAGEPGGSYGSIRSHTSRALARGYSGPPIRPGGSGNVFSGNELVGPEQVAADGTRRTAASLLDDLQPKLTVPSVVTSLACAWPKIACVSLYEVRARCRRRLSV
jgi:hypothetical protein